MITSSRLPCTASRAAAALLVMITLHGCDSAGAGTSAPTGNGADLGLFRDVLKQVEKSYVEPVKDSELVKDALKGMLTRLDPHSDYMDQEQYEQMTAVTRGQFGGIGVELTLEARVPEVIAPIDGLTDGSVIAHVSCTAGGPAQLLAQVDPPLDGRTAALCHGIFEHFTRPPGCRRLAR